MASAFAWRIPLFLWSRRSFRCVYHRKPLWIDFKITTRAVVKWEQEKKREGTCLFCTEQNGFYWFQTQIKFMWLFISIRNSLWPILGHDCATAISSQRSCTGIVVLSPQPPHSTAFPPNSVFLCVCLSSRVERAYTIWLDFHHHRHTIFVNYSIWDDRIPRIAFTMLMILWKFVVWHSHTHNIRCRYSMITPSDDGTLWCVHVMITFPKMASFEFIKIAAISHNCFFST